MGTPLKVLLLAAPFLVVVVALINQLQASRLVSVLIVFALAAAGVALAAIFGPGSDSPSPSRDTSRPPSRN